MCLSTTAPRKPEFITLRLFCEVREGGLQGEMNFKSPLDAGFLCDKVSVQGHNKMDTMYLSNASLWCNSNAVYPTGSSVRFVRIGGYAIESCVTQK